MKRFTDAAHLMVMVRRVDDPKLPADFPGRARPGRDVDRVYVHPLVGDSVGGYTVCDDIFGKPAVVLRVERSRANVRAGTGTIRYLVTSLLIIGLCFGASMAVLLERVLLARLAG